MWIHRDRFEFDRNRTSLVKWSVAVLLVSTYLGCVAFYLHVAQAALGVRRLADLINKELESVKSLEDKLAADIQTLTSQQQHNSRVQQAQAHLLMLQTESVFADLETAILDQQNQALAPGGAAQRLCRQTLLSNSSEHARRRLENIVSELWLFLQRQLLVLDQKLDLIERENWSRVTTELTLSTETNLNEEESTSDPVASGALSEDSSTDSPDHLSSVRSSTLPNSSAESENHQSNKSELVSRQDLTDLLQWIISSTSKHAITESIHRDRRAAKKCRIPTKGIRKKLNTIQSELVSYRRAMIDALGTSRDADQAEEARLLQSRHLGARVQRRLTKIQNPKSCRNRKMLVCKQKGCGFGCNFHHFVYCLIMAYATNRTLVHHRPPDSWHNLFLPITETCPPPSVTNTPTYRSDDSPDTSEDVTMTEDSLLPNQTEWLPIIDEAKPEIWPYLPLSVPEDLARALEVFHGDPAVWWVGQVASYIFRPSPVLMDHIDSVRESLQFQRPIVGVHVRRTDKLMAEARFHDLQEYMEHVQDFYEQLSRSNPETIRRVFLATDDLSVIDEAQQKYPSYTFLNIPNAAKDQASNREMYESVVGIATDIFLLSRTDFLVCTFSSQVCRLAYELMQPLHGDASRYFRSLDDIYYFGGQQGHDLRVVESYTASQNRTGTISVKKGDLVSIEGNHWNGFSVGTNRRTGERGLFPSYVAQDEMQTKSMPTYPEVV